MKVINKLTVENLKKNRKRTTVTIIGVMLSCALICAVAGFVMSFKKAFTDIIVLTDGDYHYGLTDLRKEDMKYVNNNANVDKIFYSADLGTYYRHFNGADEAKSEKDFYANEKDNLRVLGIDSKDMKEYNIKLSAGRLPENSDEIILTLGVNNESDFRKKIGDKITLDLVKTDKKYNVVRTNYESDEQYLNEMKKVKKELDKADKQTKTYTIVGLVDDYPETVRAKDQNISTMITELPYEKLIDSGTTTAFIKYKDAKKAGTITKEIKDLLKENGNDKVETLRNNELVSLSGGVSESVLKMVKGLAIFIIGIIMVTSIFVIRNSFVISVTEKTREFGILSSVGATSRQIKKSVIFEGLIIGVIGSVLGLVLGNLAIYIVCNILNIILGDYANGLKFSLVFSWQINAIAILLTMITVYLSSLIPAIKASRLNPIVAIRGNEDIKVSKKKIKTSKLTKKFLGIGGIISKKNLKRSKKKYRTTVISLVVSITIFITLSTFIKYGNTQKDLMFVNSKYNYEIRFIGEGESNEQREKTIKKILELPGIKDYEAPKQMVIDVDKKDVKDNGKNNLGHFDVLLTVLPKEKFKELANKYNIYNNLDEKAILSDYLMAREDSGKYKRIKYYNINANSDFNGKYIDVAGHKDSKNNKNEEVKKEAISIKITNEIDENRTFGMMYPTIYVSEDYVNKKVSQNPNLAYSKMSLTVDNAYEFTKEAKKLIAENPELARIDLNNNQEFKDSQDKIIIIVSIFLYGFIIVITLIGVTNIFNTITTNMILRSKEFATLKSIGMTKKEFRNMIRTETLMYSCKSLLYGIILGIIGSYVVYNLVAKKMDLGFTVSYIAIIISVIFVFLIVDMTMRYAMRKIDEQNIIETIRKDNI